MAPSFVTARSHLKEAVCVVYGVLKQPGALSVVLQEIRGVFIA